MRYFLAALLTAHLVCLSCPQQAAAQFGGRGGGDRGGSSDDRAQRMREMMERFRGGESGSRGSSREGGSRTTGSRTTGSREGGRSRGGKSKEPQRRKKIRVTVDLPEDYLDGDRDRDGQIGLYEWKEWRSRSAISAFFRLDRNRDGFLTPRELVYAQADSDDSDSDDSDGDDSSSSEDKSDTASSKTDGGKSSSKSSEDKADTASSKTDGGKGSSKSSAASSATSKLALRYFPLLDRDKNGKIDGKEWDRSKRLRPMFEKAGADLSKPMSKDEFVAMYIKASAKK